MCPFIVRVVQLLEELILVFDATPSIPQCYMGRALEHVVPSVLHCVMALHTAKVVLSVYLCCVMASHTAKVGLLATAEKSYIYCCCFAKRRRFSYDFEVSCWPADMLLLLDVNALLRYQPPTIGPTLGASFLSQAYYP